MSEIGNRNDGKARDKRSKNMGDPREQNAAEDAAGTARHEPDPVQFAAVEAIAAEPPRTLEDSETVVPPVEVSRSTVDPTSLAAREARRAPRGGTAGPTLADGEGWGRNMTSAPVAEWHGTRDGKGCRGVPLVEADPERGLLRGQCPECLARFEKDDMTIQLDAKQKTQLSREDQRREISRQIHARMCIEHKVAEIRHPDLVQEYNRLIQREYRANGL